MDHGETGAWPFTACSKQWQENSQHLDVQPRGCGKSRSEVKHGHTARQMPRMLANNYCQGQPAFSASSTTNSKVYELFVAELIPNPATKPGSDTDESHSRQRLAISSGGLGQSRSGLDSDQRGRATSTPPQELKTFLLLGVFLKDGVRLSQ